MSLIYQFLGEECFNHDLENVQYEEQEFDKKLKTQGLPQVRTQAEFKVRKTFYIQTCLSDLMAYLFGKNLLIAKPVSL